MRQIRDDAGIVWTVYEVNPGATPWRAVGSLPEGYQNGWLCFESSTEKRRLTPLPIGWQELPPDKLTDLLFIATQVRRTVQYGT
jgi:hypothetical protein